MPWTEIAPLSTPRVALAAATSVALAPEYIYRIYAIGGRTSVPRNPLFATVVAYDTTARGWSPVAPLSAPRSDLAATSGRMGFTSWVGRRAQSDQHWRPTKSTMQ